MKAIILSSGKGTRMMPLTKDIPKPMLEVHGESLLANKIKQLEDASINEIFIMLTPVEPPSIEIATQIFNNLFFSSDRYDLSDVGRVKMNSRLNLECSDTVSYTHLTLPTNREV